MRCLVFVVNFILVFGLSLTGGFLGQDDPSSDYLLTDSLSDYSDFFSDVVLQDSAEPSLTFNDGTILDNSVLDSDPRLVSGCDDGDDQLLASKFRRRDEGICYQREPPQDWLKFPDIFKIFQPKTEQQDELRNPSPNGNGDGKKCREPWRWNLCCDGATGPTGTTGFSVFYEWMERCYNSTPFKSPLLLESFVVNMLAGLGDISCPTKYDACCQRDDVSVFSLR